MRSPLIGGLHTHRQLRISTAIGGTDGTSAMCTRRSPSCVWLVHLLLLKVRGSQSLHDLWPQQSSSISQIRRVWQIRRCNLEVDATQKQMQCILGSNKLASQINFAHVNTKHVVDSLGYNHADLLKPICVLRACKPYFLLKILTHMCHVFLYVGLFDKFFSVVGLTVQEDVVGKGLREAAWQVR